MIVWARWALSRIFRTTRLAYCTLWTQVSSPPTVLCSSWATHLALGVVRSLEGEYASPTSAALMTMQRWMEKAVEREVARITAKCQRFQERQGFVLRWVERGMGERFSRAEQLEHRVQMLLGIFSAKGVLPLEFKPAYSVEDLLTQHLDELEQEAECKGGVIQGLADHFAKAYKVGVSQSLFGAAA
jgi:hypothetical protein